VPHTLLLADDSVTIQRVIELTFADEDVNVVAVGDGDQAIQRIEAAPPDIVLADIGMPGKNGYEVAQHIRQSPRLAHIPVVLLTGAFEPVDQALADEAGCEGVLAKPFEPQLVIGRVKELLARQRSKGDAPAAGVPPPAPARSEQAPGGWPPPPPQPPKGPSSAPAIELHEYFDRLDAAFSNLTPAAAPKTATSQSPSDLDWFGEQITNAPSDAPWDFPEPPSEASPAPADVPPPHADEIQATLASMPPSSAVVPAAPGQTAPGPAGKAGELPQLADAFAALLAAEQGGAPAETVLWPAPPVAAGGVSDALIDEVTRRVLERMSDSVVRETVGEIVTRVAEQLVRQEIERIKAQLR
jgi:CheY-like chemotaxis protein